MPKGRARPNGQAQRHAHLSLLRPPSSPCTKCSRISTCPRPESHHVHSYAHRHHIERLAKDRVRGGVLCATYIHVHGHVHVTCPCPCPCPCPYVHGHAHVHVLHVHVHVHVHDHMSMDMHMYMYIESRASKGEARERGWIRMARRKRAVWLMLPHGWSGRGRGSHHLPPGESTRRLPCSWRWIDNTWNQAGERFTTLQCIQLRNQLCERKV